MTKFYLCFLSKLDINDFEVIQKKNTLSKIIYQITVYVLKKHLNLVSKWNSRLLSSEHQSKFYWKRIDNVSLFKLFSSFWQLLLSLPLNLLFIQLYLPFLNHFSLLFFILEVLDSYCRWVLDVYFLCFSDLMIDWLLLTTVS